MTKGPGRQKKRQRDQGGKQSINVHHANLEEDWQTSGDQPAKHTLFRAKSASAACKKPTQYDFISMAPLPQTSPSITCALPRCMHVSAGPATASATLALERALMSNGSCCWFECGFLRMPSAPLSSPLSIRP